MEARPSSCPNVSINEDGALLKMDLAVDVGYQKLGAKARTVVMSFNFETEILIQSINVDLIDINEAKFKKRSIIEKEQQRYQIKPKIVLKELKVHNRISKLEF